MFGQVRRAVPAILSMAGILAAAACTSAHASSTASQSHAPAPRVSVSPSAPPPAAALAGGACLLLDYKVINAALGTQFDVDASAQKSGTYTCVVQGIAPQPDLALSITATSLTSADFVAQVKPSGSTSVTKLGKVGYSAAIKATASAGPSVEVGWLSGNNRLIILRYTAATGKPAAQLTNALVSLARKVDATTV
jgi:hypothetical protein